jgi:hypothetical protein
MNHVLRLARQRELRCEGKSRGGAKTTLPLRLPFSFFNKQLAASSIIIIRKRLRLLLCRRRARAQLSPTSALSSQRITIHSNEKQTRRARQKSAAATRARVNFMRRKVWDFKDAELLRSRIEFSFGHAKRFLSQERVRR